MAVDCIHGMCLIGECEACLRDLEEELEKEAEAMSEENKLSLDDPAFLALKKTVEILDPFDRAQQMRILAGTCILLGEYDYAQAFLTQLIRDKESKLSDAQRPARAPR